MLDLDFLAFPWARNEWIVSAGITACTGGGAKSRLVGDTVHPLSGFSSEIHGPNWRHPRTDGTGENCPDHAAVGVSWRNIAISLIDTSTGGVPPDFSGNRWCQFWGWEERGRMPRTLGTGHAAGFLSSSLNDVSKLPNFSSCVPPTCR
jgi:hypothetical protein